MAGAKFQYDESGGTFFYFLLSFLALVIIPCTYYFWPKNDRKDDTKRDRKQCHCDQCAIKTSYLRSKEPWRNAKRRIIKLLLIIGWIAIVACGYKVANLQHDYINWDPFEILQIDPSSSTAEIKKAYRRLSLIYHPDKETGDEKKFLKIAKAYAALTDEEARKNWETYGNPDGPGAMSFGIALPSWIVEKENSIIVLGLYAAVFMIALPLAVGIWWYRSIKFGTDQVLIDTTQIYFYFIHKTPHMIMKRIIMVIAASFEFEKRYNSEVTERPTDNYEVPQLMKELPNLGEKNKERPLCYLYSIKARALLHAHLSRLKLPPNTLENDKLYIVRKCPYLLQEFVQCVSQLITLALAGRIQRTPNLDTLENAMKLSSLIVQGLWDSKNSLMQLPHINEDVLRHFTTRKRNVKSVTHLASMKNSERRTLLRNLNDDQYEDVIKVISKMPLLEMDVKTEVLDDEDADITAGAIVTVTVSLTRQNMSVLFDNDNVEHEKHDAENDEGIEEIETVPNGSAVQESPHVKKPKAWEKQGKGKKKGGKGAKGKKKQTMVVNKKKQINQANAVVPANVTKDESNDTKVVKRKEKKDSDPENDSVDESQNSESDTDDASNEKKVNAKTKDEDVSDNEDEWNKFQQKAVKKEKVLETKSKKSHPVHCPYFPDDKQEYWWIYIADRKRHSLITVPYLMTNLVTNEKAELKFTAPHKPGIYTYTVIVKSDSYVDFDLTHAIKLNVKEEPKKIDNHPQWDISDDEEQEKDEESGVEDSDLMENSEDDDDEESDD